MWPVTNDLFSIFFNFTPFHLICLLLLKLFYVIVCFFISFEIFNSFETIITIEDGTIKGGFGSAIVEFSAENNYSKPIKVLGIPDNFIEHGTVEELQKICKIDVKSLINLFSNGTK